MRSPSPEHVPAYLSVFFSMAVAREKQKAHRVKTKEALKAKASAKLVEPMAGVESTSPIREKIKVPVKKSRSALVPGGGQSMGMDVD